MRWVDKGRFARGALVCFLAVGIGVALLVAGAASADPTRTACGGFEPLDGLAASPVDSELLHEEMFGGAIGSFPWVLDVRLAPENDGLHVTAERGQLDPGARALRSYVDSQPGVVSSISVRESCVTHDELENVTSALARLELDGLDFVAFGYSGLSDKIEIRTSLSTEDLGDLGAEHDHLVITSGLPPQNMRQMQPAGS